MTERSRTPATRVTVLVVDPDQGTRAEVRGYLESHRYRVLDAGDPVAAERIARLYVGPIHVLLVDRHVEQTGGPALADRLQSLHPELRVLSMSARGRAELVKAHEISVSDAFIQKPFDSTEIAARIRSLLDVSER
jgi:DNA-binding response OmpR family regulator